MKTPLVLTLIAASLFTAPALAGSALSPEVTDAAGDAPGSVDIVSLWVSATAAEVSLNLKLADLASEPDPAFDNEGSWHNVYRIEYTLSSTGASYYAEVQISAVESQSAAGVSTQHLSASVISNVGTQYSAGRIGGGTVPAGTAVVDAANNLITVKLTRDSSLAPGTIVTGVKVTTFQNPTPHEMQNNFTPILGGGRNQKDTTTAASRPYTLPA